MEVAQIRKSANFYYIIGKYATFLKLAIENKKLVHNT